MAADSPFRAIQESTLEFLLSVDGMASAVAVPPWMLFKPLPEGGEVLVITPDKMPPLYPGAVVSIWEDHVKVVGEPQQDWSSAQVTYEVPVSIALYAISDGSDENAARFAVLKLGQAVHVGAILFTPSGFPANSASFGPMIPDEWNAIPIDANTAGLMLDFRVRYQISVSLNR